MIRFENVGVFIREIPQNSQN